MASLISDRSDSPNAWLKADYRRPEYSQNDKDDDFTTSFPRQRNIKSLGSRKLGGSSTSSTRDVPRKRDVSPKNPSGSKGKLGYALERMHDGELLSQHDVASALSDYNTLLRKIDDLEKQLEVAKLRVPEDEADGIAPPGASKITREEKDKLMEQLKRKDKLIAEYQTRIQNLTHKTKTRVMNNVHVEEVVPPEKVIDNFVDLYEKEWFHAFETLKSSWKDEERVLFSLFRIVRHAYVFCFDLAEMQRTAVEDYTARLQEIMLHPAFIHPISKLKYKPSAETSPDNQRHLEFGKRLINDYRNILASQAVTGVQELFRKVKLPEIFEHGVVNNAVKDYVNRAVQLIWLMVIQDPPMLVYWLEPKQTVTKQYFKYYKRKKPYVIQTVWPAVFRHEGGALLSRGVVLAGGAEDFKDSS
ncbi:hypothetical protein ACF0H5_011374 [Mactra antiquata]